MIIRTVILLLYLNVCLYAQESIPFKKTGEIKPRHAKEIEASPWSVGAETMDREYTIYANWNQHLGPLGVKKARIQSGWRKTEPRKGTYDFTWLDTIIYNMHDQKVKPWMNLSFGNPLYTEFKGDPVRGDIPKTAEAKRAWNAFVKQLVVRYQHIINEWEIWNEPAYYKNITPEEYVELVIATGDAIRSIQPNASLYLFAYGHGQLKKQLSEECIEPDDPCNYAKKVMDILEKKNRLDLVTGVTIHPYEYNPDEFNKLYPKVNSFFKRYKNDILIVQGECGVPSEKNKKRALANYDWNEVSQAKWALRRLLGDLANDVYFSSYFGIIDMKYPNEVNQKGLIAIKPDKTIDHRKQAYYAVQHLTAIFDNTLEKIDNYAYQADNDQSISVFAYENKYSNQQAITLWFDGDIPSDSNEKTKVDFSFYQGQFEDPVYVDLRTGEIYEIPAKNWRKKGATYEFKDIPVYDSPMLIADKSLVLMEAEGR